MDARGFGGGMVSLSIDLFVNKEKEMEFSLGVLAALCLALLLQVFWMAKFVVPQMKAFGVQVDALAETIGKVPTPVQNVIHLGLKDTGVVTGLAPATLSIRSEDFRVQADKVYQKLVNGLKVKEHPDTGILAYCILRHAGVDNMVNNQSSIELQKALTRLLLNGDDEATKRFLRTLADSVGQAQMDSEDAIH